MTKDIKSKLRKGTMLGVSFLFALLSVLFFYYAYHYNQFVLNPIIGASFLGLALGVYRQYQWALRGAAFVLLLAAIILPGGVFNPFTAGDYLVIGKEPPSVSQTLIWLIPIEIVLLALAFIVDPPKRTDNKQSWPNKANTADAKNRAAD